jgi:curved DNA-binding protein CbpA
MRITIAEARTVLQVESSATEIELKRAFKKQALLTHPDKNLDDPTAKVSALHRQTARQCTSSI